MMVGDEKFLVVNAKGHTLTIRGLDGQGLATCDSNAVMTARDWSPS